MPDVVQRLSSADQSIFPMYNVWQRKDLAVRRKIKLYRHVQAIVKYGSQSIQHASVLVRRPFRQTHAFWNVSDGRVNSYTPAQRSRLRQRNPKG